MLNIKDLYRFNPKGLTAIIDVFAFAENLPLRILDNSSVDELDLSDVVIREQRDENYSFELVNEVSHYISSIIMGEVVSASEEVKNFVHDITSSFGKEYQVSGRSDVDSSEELMGIEQRVFLNQPSNLLHINNVFRLSDEWRWFEMFWLFSISLNNKKEGRVKAFGMQAWDAYFTKFNNGDNNEVTLLVGPISRANSKTYKDKISDEIISGFFRFLEEFGSNSYTNIYMKEDLERIFSARDILSEGTIEKRFGKIQKYFETLFLLENTDEYWTKLPVAEYSNLARLIVNYIRLKSEEGLDLPSNFANLLEKKSFKIPNKPFSKNIYREFGPNLESWKERIFARSRNSLTLRSQMTSDWLSSHSMIEGLHFNEIGNRLARFILEITRSDICNIYYYQRGKARVELSGYAYSNGVSKEYIDPIKDNMESVLISPMEVGGDYSSTSKVGFCIRSRKYYENSEVKNGDIYWSEECGPMPKSVLIMPIFFQDRVVGAVEVKNNKENSFQSNSRFALNSFASSIGQYFYNRKLIQSIKNINDKTLSSDGEQYASTGRSKYCDDICDSLCNIFLCDAATLWLKDPDSGDQTYEASGHAGFELFRDELLNNSRKVELSLVDLMDEESLTKRMVNYYLNGKTDKIVATAKININGEDFDPIKDSIYENNERYTLGKKYFSENNIRPYRKALKSSEFSEIRVFLLARDDRKEADETGKMKKVREVYGAVNLYFRYESGLPHWADMIGLLTELLGKGISRTYYDYVAWRSKEVIYRHELKETLNRLLELTPILNENQLYFLGKRRKLPQFIKDIVVDRGFQTRVFENSKLQSKLIKMLLRLVEEEERSSKLLIDHSKQKQTYDILVNRFAAKADLQDIRDSVRLEDMLQIPNNEPLYSIILEVYRDSFMTYRDKLRDLSVWVNTESYRLSDLPEGISDIYFESDPKGYSTTSKVMDFNGEGIPKGLVVYFTRTGLTYVFNNVFQNIVKYSNPGSRVLVFTETFNALDVRQTADKKSFRIKISNYCNPVDPHIDTEKLFELNFRMKIKGVGIQPEGDGVGLALVRQICRLYGCEVNAKYNFDDAENTWRFDLTFTIPESRTEMISYFK